MIARIAVDDFTLNGFEILCVTAANYDGCTSKGFVETASLSRIGWHGGCTDGTYAYLAPSQDASNGWHGIAMRILLSDFSGTGMTTRDLAADHAKAAGTREYHIRSK